MNEEEIRDLIAKSDLSLLAARELLKLGFNGFSASRSYYTMFYAAEALLLTKELRFHKHFAVLSALGSEFVSAGIFPKHLHSFLTSAFDMRNAGDYTAKDVVTKGAAEKY